MLCEEGRCDRVDNHASLHVLGNRQAEQITQGWGDVRRIDRSYSAPRINSFSEKNEKAVGRSFRGGMPRFSAANEPFHSLEGAWGREAKGGDHRNQNLIVGGTEQIAEVPIDKLHYQLEE